MAQVRFTPSSASDVARCRHRTVSEALGDECVRDQCWRWVGGWRPSDNHLYVYWQYRQYNVCREMYVLGRREELVRAFGPFAEEWPQLRVRHCAREERCCNPLHLSLTNNTTAPTRRRVRQRRKRKHDEISSPSQCVP